jgi:hypothetical protein
MRREGTLGQEEAVLDEILIADGLKRGAEDGGEVFLDSLQERREGLKKMRATAGDKLFAKCSKFTVDDTSSSLIC